MKFSTILEKIFPIAKSLLKKTQKTDLKGSLEISQIENVCLQKQIIELQTEIATLRAGLLKP